ncbi:MAG TPA: aminotransferase class IV [Solirubrobacteraceae bacterium]|nr:aminotransferase class IV [Solirubrobacteraceae bacterium]
MAHADPQLQFEPAPHADVALGVFETLLVADGSAVDYPRHLARLATSLHELYRRSLPTSLHERIEDAARGRALARLRVDVGPADGAEGEIRVEDLDASFVLPERESELVTVSVSGGFGAHKLADRVWLEQIEAAAGEGVRALLVTGAGELLETTRANVFLVRGGVVATPPLEGAILPGVTREVLLERARRAGISAHELPLTLADLRDADAVLLVSSLRRIECARVRGGEDSRETLARLRAELAP